MAMTLGIEKATGAFNTKAWCMTSSTSLYVRWLFVILAAILVPVLPMHAGGEATH